MAGGFLNPNEGEGDLDPTQFEGAFFDDPAADGGIIDDTLHLSDVDRGTAAWKRIESYLEKRLAELRIMNDMSLSILETENLRGKIALTIEILALGIEPAAEDDSDGPKVIY